jgi:hypothetical protein
MSSRCWSGYDPMDVCAEGVDQLTMYGLREWYCALEITSRWELWGEVREAVPAAPYAMHALLGDVDVCAGGDA